jgi:polyribonucleotide nucleotidyltransferase
MVEAAAKEVSEEVMISALAKAHDEIKKICEFQLSYAKNFDIQKREAIVVQPKTEWIEKVSAVITGEMLDEVKGVTKKEIKKKIFALQEQIAASFGSEIGEGAISQGELNEILQKLLEKRMRKNILEKEVRLDGRKINEIRPISVEVDILPRTHGSAIFRRGETMALTVTTLGSPGDAQLIDTMDSDITKRYIHHYNFPPYAVGEIKPLRGPGRREIGHGDLAERALLPVLPSHEDFGYTMWLVSEIVLCNGSSSMASVCGSTLSLMAAGVPIKKPVSGIAMGLVSDPETGAYKILSDIQGMEDFAGDMDFKVTGTRDGITALQMDIKVKGLSMDIMREALQQANEGREFILQKMLEVIPEPRKVMSKYAPLIMNKQIDPDMIRLVIGKGGETIQKITAECECEIDIADEGLITITAPDQERGNKALEMIEKITYVPKVGDVFEGKVVRLMDFGAFVEIVPGKDGLVHISELDTKRVNKVEDVVKVGDTLKVKLIKIDDQGRLNLSHKVLMDGGSEGGSGSPQESSTPTEEGKGGHGTRVEGTTSVRRIN